MTRRLIFSRTLAQSFAAATILLVVVIIGTTLFIVRSRVASTLQEGLEARGASIARSIGAVATPSLLAYNYPALQIAAEGAAEDEGVVYVLIHDKEGAVAGMKVNGPVSGSVSSPLASVPGSIAVSTVHAPQAGGSAASILEVLVPVLVEGVEEPWGAVRVGLSFEPMEMRLRRIVGHLVGLGATLALAAAASGIWLARRITAPLRRLAVGTEALASGNTSYRIPASGARELADLAGAFNTMMDRVRDKAAESEAFQKALETLNATLEEQVRERTRALEESEAQYKTLVQNSPDSIFIVQQTRVRFVNRSFEEIFGVSSEEAKGPGFDLDRIFDRSSSSLVRGRIDAWLRGEAPSGVEVLGKDAGGTTRHLELRGSRIEYRGEPAAECLLIDTTEARRLREKLTETEKLRALGELAGGVAHDFNNLLGAILGRAQLLKRRGLGPAVDRDLGVIEKAAQDGRETIRRIQEFSRTRRDRRFLAVDLAEVILDAVEITRTRWKAEAERRNVSIRVEVDTQPVPPILGNASELREVFTNLVLNSVDAMPQGGKLCLSCRREDGAVIAEVADTGVGMTEEIRRQLFDPFFTTKGTRGMGLGLSVAYGIMRRHEGKIDVRSALGKGTTFVLEFPVAAADVLQHGGDGAELPHLVRTGRILVIDDEPDVGDVVRDILVGEGHAVDTAVSGQDGLRLLAASEYDMVFTDLGMPDMSGWEVAERIGEARPGLPVALVTGWGMSLDEEEARRKGIAAIVHKPFDIRDLVQTASDVLLSSGNGQKR